jgi:hypothetical protein
MEKFERTLNDLRVDFLSHKTEVADVFNQLFGRFDNINDNRLVHLQLGINDLSAHQVKMEVDIDWLKYAFWAVFASSISALIVGVVNLVSK